MSVEGGKRLKACREAAGHTQERFAELLNISTRTLAGYETGERPDSGHIPDDVIKAAAERCNAPLLAYKHLKETSVLRDYIPEIDNLQTNGDLGFQLALVKDEIPNIYETARDILKDGAIDSMERPDWEFNTQKIESVVGKLLSILAYSKRIK